jgi:hypothetical protein
MKRLGFLVLCTLFLIACDSIPSDNLAPQVFGLDGVSVDISGSGSNVYVAGFPAGSQGLLLSKFDSVGKTLWSKNFLRSYSSIEMTTDKNGNSYVAGFDSQIGSSGGLFIRKFNTRGGALWETQFAPAYSDSSRTLESVYGITTDNAGNIYVLTNVITRGDLINFNYQVYFYVRKYNPSGVLTTTFISNQGGSNSATPSGRPFPYSLRIDAANNVYVFYDRRIDDEGLDASTGFKVLKFSPTGTQLWDRLVYSDVYQGTYRFQEGDFTLDSQSNIYVAINQFTCNFQGQSCGRLKVNLRKLDSNAGFLWSKEMYIANSSNTPASFSARNYSIGRAKVQTDLEDNVYLATRTYTFDSADVKNTFLLSIKYDKAGNRLWRSEFPAPANNVFVFSEVAVTEGVYLTGAVQPIDVSSPGFSYLLKLDKATGNRVFSKQ